jgi:hypothetical protein
MRFMMMVKSDSTVPPTPELMEAMGELIQRETAAGRLIDTGGLMPKSQGFEVRLANGEIEVTDGPFAEAREVVGGYAIFEFASREEAVASGIEFLELHRKFAPGWEGVCDARQMATE